MSLGQHVQQIGRLWIVFVTAAQGTLLISAAIELRRLRTRDRYLISRRVMGAPLIPKVSILVPAYREELSIVASVTSLLALSYPNLEIVVVNDGSPDSTLERLVKHFDLRNVHPAFQRVVATADIRSVYRSTVEPRLVVIDKFNGGKADSLNAALNVATGELVCAVDADTLVAPGALQQLVAPFMSRSDTAAVGGTIRLTNDSIVQGSRVTNLEVPRNWLAAIQVVEYIRAFTIGRLGWNPLGGNLVISGAFGLFRRQLVLDVGGYERDTVGEDMELIARIRRNGYETRQKAWVEFLPDPVAWTEAPESVRTLGRQRNRWHRGLIDVLIRHRKMMFNPRYGSAGMLAMPYYLIVEFLASLVEVLGLVWLIGGIVFGSVQLSVLWLVLAMFGMGAAVTILSVWLDNAAFGVYPRLDQRARLVGYAILEQFVFRPMTLTWRVWGTWSFIRGRAEWGEQVRRGFTTS